jgi:hypothetical protein
MPIDRFATRTSDESFRYFFTDPEDYRRAMRRAAYLESVGCPTRAWRVRLNLDGVPVSYAPVGAGKDCEVKLPEPRREPGKRIYKPRNRKLEYAQRVLREAGRAK